jgi:hypothetical protein
MTNTKSTLTAGVTEHLSDTPDMIGFTGKTIVITKQGEEGGFEVDAFSGVVLRHSKNAETGQWEGIELPAWAEGLTNALLTERHIFYTSRLGGLYTDAMKQPEALCYEDLSWVHVTPLEEPRQNEETGQMEHVELSEVEADHEFRMGIIAEVTGIAGDVDLAEGTFGKDALTVAIERDNMRTEEELASMEQASREGFKAVNG